MSWKLSIIVQRAEFVSLLQPRHDKRFNGLTLDDELAERDVVAQCGLQDIGLKSGDIAHCSSKSMTSGKWSEASRARRRLAT